MIKDIIVNLTLGHGRDTAARYAVSLASALQSHVTGIAFRYEAVVETSLMGGLPPEVIEQQQAESEQAARDAIAQFDAIASGSGVQTESHVMDATLTGAGNVFGRLARRYDVSVVAQAEPGKTVVDSIVAEGALFESGRPLIMLPFIHRNGFSAQRVMVCWDGSRTAARALGDAIPIIQRAERVEIVIAATGPSRTDEIPGADIATHLARHGLNVDLKRIVIKDGDIANALLSYAADYSADFMVMGGFGHSRLREFVLGGVTRVMLQSMTVPALLSH